jgi:hypothetical protein
VDALTAESECMDAQGRLLITVVAAALLFTLLSWASVFVYAVMVHEISQHGTMAAVAIVLFPDVMATFWIFRRLQVNYSRGDARRAATAFAASAPLTLALGYMLGGLVGGYAEATLGGHFIIPAIVVFIVTSMILVPSSVVAWALHPSGGIWPVGESDQDEHR